ncbi:hypothetical protein LSH36_224g05029 [Paralvinella palmiformis]|uniref:U6 snRNA phosphodiesterase n=1 Tax=Paralvinella palmiformis TaxID=53620 RepID=A0AAD9JP45_9ANNE|nr:hypothetical protein LSH36_224g05029 [Paralvinella palmiformis]
MELISGYSSESDDENIDDDKLEARNNLKRESSTTNDDKTSKKLKFGKQMGSRLPLPTDIQSMFVAEPETKNDPEQHDGRIRTFSHERGNWASFVYAYVSPFQEECFRDITQYLIDVLRPVGDFHACEDFHLSLSRTFVLRHHWIEPLVKCLKQKLAVCQRITLVCGDLEWYCNDEETRTFLAMHVADEAKILTSYTKSIDSVLEDFKLPPYYEDPSFHISLAWCLGDVRERLKKHVPISDIETKVSETGELVEGLEVGELRLKTGNRIVSLPLSKS